MFHLRSFKFLVALGLLILALPPSVALGQAPQGPADPFHSEFVVTNPPSQFDEIALVIEIAPGTTTAPTSYGGDQFVTVIEGQVTRRELVKPAAETQYNAGNTYVEKAGQMHELVNAGTGRARLIATLLLPKGAALTASGQMPAGANVIYRARREFLTPPTRFKAVQDVLEFAPGVFVPQHWHGGDVLGLVIEGEITNRNAGSETKLHAGDGFTENTGQVHSIGNASSAPAAFFGTILLPPGGALITIQAAPPNTLPTTGAPNQDWLNPGLAFLVGASLLASGWLVRKRLRRA